MEDLIKEYREFLRLYDLWDKAEPGPVAGAFADEMARQRSVIAKLETGLVE